MVKISGDLIIFRKSTKIQSFDYNLENKIFKYPKRPHLDCILLGCYTERENSEDK